MKRSLGRCRIWLLALALAALLSGCMMSASVEDLYSLPQLPVEYQALSAQIESILASGAEYTAPTSGTNLQSVQLVDLNGDGVEEALAFFRNTNDERPMKIYIFRAVEDTYEQVSVIEGSGTSIHSIQYVDMNNVSPDSDSGAGVKEILVSWRVSAEVQAMAVYVLEELQPVLAMSTAYARCEVVDLDDDDMQELVVLRSDETESGGSIADYYDWDGGSLLLRSSARLSMTVAELQWMQAGTLRSGETAVFVTGRVAGVEETSRAITDILVYREGELTNIALSSSTGISSQISRFVNLQPADINGDGATEVPMPAQLPGDGEDYWKIYWFSYDTDGSPDRQTITYHNQTDSWYLLIPDQWDGNFTVRQNNASSTEHSTTFYSVSNDALAEELFTIYSLTGPNRIAQASTGGRMPLRRQSNVVYAISYAPTYDSWRYAVEQDNLVGRFNAILTQWSTEED